MKHIAIIILLLTIGVTAYPQDIQTYQSEISKAITIGQATSTHVLDASFDRLILLTNKAKRQSTSAEYITSDYMILDIDSTMYLNNKMVIKDTKDKSLIAYNSTENYIVLLFREVQSKQDIITRIKIGKDTIHEINRMTIDTIPHRRNDEVFFWHKSSPQKNSSAYTYVIANKDSWQCRSTMLDNKMDILWKKESDIEAINDISVTENGELHLIGCQYELASSTTNFYYEMITEDTITNNKFTINDVFLDAYILRSTPSNITITGCIYSKESRKKEIKIGGMYSLFYNNIQNKHQLEVRQFSHEDLCVLYNKDIDTKKIAPYIDNLAINYTTTMDNGGIVTAQRQLFNSKTNTNGTSSITYYNSGIIAMRIDNTGHIIWERPIRHQQEQSNGFHYLNYALFTDHNTTYIIQSEDDKVPLIYNNNKAIKNVTPTVQKSNIAMYTIDETGNVTKQILSTNDKSAIYGTCPQWFDDHFYYIIGYSDKCKLLTFKRNSK